MKKRTEELISAFTKDNPGVEAIVLYQNGETVIEHRFVPKKPRLIYSHTKSFISTAVGMAIDAGKLKLDDKFIDLYPEYESVITDENVKKIELRHFLTMSSGFGQAFLMDNGRRTGEGFPDCVAYMLSKPLLNTPGEKFLYSNADTHLAGYMAQRALGEPLLKYCYKNIFSKLGIGFPFWETDANGTAFGGSGLYLDITDMMKLGILYLNKGIWNGEQIVSSEWVEQATKRQIEAWGPKPWSRSYGYQFWMVEQRPNAYRADGAYGQLSIVLPEDNSVLATQCSEQNDTAKFVEMLQKYAID